jgi:hypothetical protein
MTRATIALPKGFRRRPARTSRPRAKAGAQAHPTAGREPVKSLAEAWTALEAAYDPAAGPMQRREVRRGFYCGAASALGIVLAILDSGQDPTEEDVARLHDLDAEVMLFFADLKAGRA